MTTGEHGEGAKREDRQWPRQEMKDRLRLIERHENKIVEACGLMLKAGNSNLYSPDLFFVGVINRFVMLSKGIRMHIEQRNFVCAAPLVRCLLDSLLRLYAVSLVDDKDSLLLQIIEGGRSINRTKDRDGEFMNDKYLVRKLAGLTQKPELVALYNDTSGFVHFSEKHLFASAKLSSEDNRFRFSIGGREDSFFPDSAYEEVTTAAHDMFEILFVFLVSWINEKDPNNKVQVILTEA